MTEQEVLENFLKLLKANPLSAKTKRVVISDGNKEEVLFETSKQVVLNDAGVPETILLSKPRILDDGSSLAEVGVTRCQTCQGLVKLKSLARCPCGRTCCLRKGCGKVWFGAWFCSLRCVALYKLSLLRRF